MKMLIREEKWKPLAKPNSLPKKFCEEHLVEIRKDCPTYYTILELWGNDYNYVNKMSILNKIHI
jgi:hypothetical protein